MLKFLKVILLGAVICLASYSDVFASPVQMESETYKVSLESESLKLFKYLKLNLFTKVEFQNCKKLEVKSIKLTNAININSANIKESTGHIDIIVSVNENYSTCEGEGPHLGEVILFLGNDLPFIQPGRWEITINQEPVGFILIDRGFEVGNG